MKMQGFAKPCLGFVFLVLTLSFTIKTSWAAVAQVTGAIVAAKDVINMVKDVTSAVSEIWSVIDSSSTQAENNNLTIILSRFKDVSKEITLTEDKHAEAINNFINLHLLTKRNDITNTIDAISARFRELQQHLLHQDKLESSTLLSFAEWTASPNGFSVQHLMDRLHLSMFGADDGINKGGTNIFEMLVSSYGNEEKCLNQQSTQQFIYSLYTDIALTELKGYTMLEMSWMILKAYGKGNFTQEGELMRSNYKRRTKKTVRLLNEVMQQADRTVWRCDPYEHVEGKSYEQVTRLIQGYIENEVDMSSNRDCMQSCAAYGRTKNEGCYIKQFCGHQERCSGQIHDCIFAGASITACPSALESLRRYEYIEFQNFTAGKKSSCARGEAAANSWMRYIWDCSYCYCLCDDQNSIKTERYFNLRETLSNVNDNKVVTGLRFIKINRIFHLQIQEGQLLSRGMINELTLIWKPVDNYTLYERGVNNNQDYFTLTYDSRSIDLDDIESNDSDFVVTGVRFRVVYAHLNLQIRLSKFDFETGQLLEPNENSYWKYNAASENRRTKLELKELDVPTKSRLKSQADSTHNQYLQFSQSSLEKDVAQTTLPFIDIQDVASKPAVPLAGIGIFHKGRPGYGGYLAPRLMTYDFVPHIHLTNKN